MPDTAKPIIHPEWNRQKKLEDAAIDRLKGATFILNLGSARWGTGFFIDAKFALTAYHNVKPRDKTAPQTEFIGHRMNESRKGEKIELTFTWRAGWSSESADIAVLELAQGPEGFKPGPVEVCYIGGNITEDRRKNLWHGRSVVSYGFPFRGTGQVGEPYLGSIHRDEPITFSDEKSLDGYGSQICGKFRRINIVCGQTLGDLPGISGAPVYDLDLGQVIGVVGSCASRQILAAEIWDLLEQLGERGCDVRKPMVPLFGELNEPAEGVAALLGHSDSNDYFVAPVTTRFYSRDNPEARVPESSRPAQPVAEAALRCAGAYLRKFEGTLQDLIGQYHLGAGKPYNSALFDLPEGNLEFAPPLLAAMVLSYLSELLRQALVFDFDLPAAVPPRLFICAAGFNEDFREIASEPGAASALRAFRFPGLATVFHSHSQDTEFQQLDDLPAEVRLVPADAPEDMIHGMIAQYVVRLRSSEVASALSRRFKAPLEDLLETEKQIDDAGLAHLSRAERDGKLDVELKILYRQEEFLKSKINDAGRCEQTGEAIPSPSQILEELEREIESWRKEFEAPDQDMGNIDLILVVPDETIARAERCKRLRKRLSLFSHPDKGKDSAWFLHIWSERYREDLLFLQALEGLLDPLGNFHEQPRVEDTISRLFDRLAELRSVERALAGRVSDKKEGLSAMQHRGGAKWKEVERARDALEVIRQRVEGLWRELRYKLGTDLAG